MQNLLDLRPNRLREFIRNEKRGGNITVLVPKFGTGKIGRWLHARMKKPDYLIHLDDFGSCVWNQCNGEKQVREISTILVETFGEKVEPVNGRLSLFLKKMEQSHLIIFAKQSDGCSTPCESTDAAPTP